MELGESIRRLARPRARLMAGVGAAALVAAAPVAAWADQSNNNSSTTNAPSGAAIVAPITGAVQANLACPANLNVLGTEQDTGSCAPAAQSNTNSSATTTGGDDMPGLLEGAVVAPITAAGQVNVSCPINVNVLSTQRDSGNCTPGEQSNSNSADTQSLGGGTVTDILGGPIVAPITAAVGVNVTCPTSVNVLSDQQASGGCQDSQTPTSQGTPPSPPPADSPPPAGDSAPPSGDSPPGDSPSGMTDTAATSTTADAPPGPPTTGAMSMARAAGRFPVLGALVLAALAAAAIAVRRFRLQR